MKCIAIALATTLAVGTVSAAPRHWAVCPEPAPGCDFAGGPGIQAAIDAAAPGDTVNLRPGRYFAQSYREVPYKEVVVRGFVVVDCKDLTLTGEPGAVLDGGEGPPTTAIVVRNARTTIRGLTITGFRFDVQEDDFYEGHGLFVIDGDVRATDLTISRFQKMGLIGRGATRLVAERLQIVDGHVGIWLHETAYLALADCVVSRNDSSAIAAYDDSAAHVRRCTFEDNQDDGLFTEHRATVYAEDSRITGNRPYGARAVGDSTIWLIGGEISGNARDTTGSRGRARVRIAQIP
jgi:nitrous oxidase accessory protein NosD